MLINARELSAGATIEADIIIVGGGPAGLCLAHELRGTGYAVAVLESGDIAHNHKANHLADPAQGFRHGGCQTLDSTRRLGGNAHCWHIQSRNNVRSVRFARYSDADFQPKTSRGNVGWPFPQSSLDAYYARAQRFVELPERSFDPTDYETPDVRRLPLDPRRVETAMFQFPEADAVAVRRVQDLIASSNVTVYTHATAQSLVVAEGGARVAGVRGVSDPGRGFVARGREVVLCANGFGNPQILLSSTDASPAGVGNDHDNVGRWYMNHPLVDGGDFTPASKAMMGQMALYDARTVNGADVLGYMHIAPETLQAEDLLNISFLLFPAQKGHREKAPFTPRQSRGAHSAFEIRHALQEGRTAPASDWRNVLVGFDGLARVAWDKYVNRRLSLNWSIERGGWSDFADFTRHFDQFSVIHQAEQAPHRDNRVLLSDERDPLGGRRYTVDWRFHKEDQDAVMRAQDVFAAEVRKAGVGTFVPLRRDGKLSIITDSTVHIMGTTRMHDDPRQGVVDANCKVHGLANLHIASSSVFPTGGYANPTFTILALSIRLADELKNLLASGKLAA